MRHDRRIVIESFSMAAVRRVITRKQPPWRASMPEPLAALDDAGKAAVLSYDVPEPISYSGRNFLELPLDAAAFTVVVPPLPVASAIEDQPVGRDLAVRRPALLAPADVVLVGD